MLQPTFPVGFIAPCLPTKTDKLPSGSRWLHEIKRDGFRVIARKTGARVRLYSRPGDRARDLGRLAAAADKGRALPAAQSFGTIRPRRLDLARPQLAPAAEIRSYQEAANARVKRLAKAFITYA